MKLFNIFSLGVLMACAFSSCEMKKELTSDLEESFEMGALELDVTVKQPVSNSRAESDVPTNNFPVVIQGTSEGIEDVKKEYNTVDGVPETIQVPVGNYNVSSHTPGELQKKMDAPYYAGNTDITVTKDIETVANVVCKMANSRIQVNYGDEFKTSFKSWTITVDDGSETALPFTNEDENPAPVYWLFGENVKSITVNITAITNDGNTVRDRRVFIKSDASENYEDVFRNDMDPERIFSIAFVEAENVTSFTNDFLINVTNVAESEFVNNPIQVGSTAQWVTLTDEHTAFIRGTDYDSRSDVNISEFTTPQGRSYRWINKYLGTWKGGTRIFDSDLPIYRYAEAVLFKAEIEICRHNFTEALTYINQIAKRAYGIDDYYSGTYSQTEIETILLDERLKEFATEGKAWFDLIRFGQVFSRVESLHGRENEENILLWPVNNESINTNPNIKQTPGYD